MNILNRIIQITGVDRGLVAEIFNVPLEQVATWEVDESTIPVATLSFLVKDFEDATEYLDALACTWDQAIPFRQAAYKLEVSPYTLSFMLARRGIEPMDFGRLGLWLHEQDLIACRQS